MVELTDLVKRGDREGKRVTLLDHVDLKFDERGFVVILGGPASGKTELLQVLAGLSDCDKGQIHVWGTSLTGCTDLEKSAFRNKNIGYLTEKPELLADLSVFDNVALPLVCAGMETKQRQKKVGKLLTQMGLAGCADVLPAQLSQSQKIRCAIARAMVNSPSILLAEDPTPYLEEEGLAAKVMELLSSVAQRSLVIFVSENEDLARKYANRILVMEDGGVIFDTGSAAEDAEEEEAESKKALPKGKTVLSLGTCVSLNTRHVKRKVGRTILHSLVGGLAAACLCLGFLQWNAFSAYEDRVSKDMVTAIDASLLAPGSSAYDDWAKDFPGKSLSFSVNAAYGLYYTGKDESLISALSMESSGEVFRFDKSSFFEMPKGIETCVQPSFMEEHRLFVGQWPENESQVVLLTGEELSPEAMEAFLGQKIYPVTQANMYEKQGDVYVRVCDEQAPEQSFVEEKGIPLTICGVALCGENDRTGIGFTGSFQAALVDAIEASSVVAAQKQQPDRNMLTGYCFDTATDAQKQADAAGYLMQLGDADKVDFFTGLSDEVTVNYLPSAPEVSGLDQASALLGTTLTNSKETAASVSGNVSGNSVTGNNGKPKPSQTTPSAGGEAEPFVITFEDYLNGFASWIGQADGSILMSVFEEKLLSGSFEENMALFGAVNPEDYTIVSVQADTIEEQVSMAAFLDDHGISRYGYAAEHYEKAGYYVTLLSFAVPILGAGLGILCLVLYGFGSYLSVLERKKRFGILRMLGTTKRNLGKVILLEDLFVGFISGCLSVVIFFGLERFLSFLAIKVLLLTGFVLPITWVHFVCCFLGLLIVKPLLGIFTGRKGWKQIL